MIIKEWQCEECEKIYKYESDALHCECYTRNRRPIEIVKHIKCDMCGKELKTDKEVIDCESLHKELDDHYYDAWKTKQAHYNLGLASTHGFIIKDLEEIR